MMKAAVLTQYGTPDVIQYQEVAKPTPKANEVLVRVRATSVNFGDTFVREFNKITPRTFTMPSPLWFITRLALGVFKPRVKILGSEFAGEVAAVGDDVTDFSIGDQVFGYLGQTMGANAEYLRIAANGLIAHKPANLSYEEAATIPYGAITAISLLRTVDIQPGQKVLINGASGGIGSAAVQLARHYGAEVTGVCGAPRMEMVSALGADHVIDYKKEDFTRNGERYDVIFDIMNKSSFAKCQHSLTDNGRYLLASFKIPQLIQMLRTRNKNKKVICALSSESQDDLRSITELAAQGVLKAYVDRSFPLERAAEAHRYMESGRKQGSVVINVASV